MKKKLIGFLILALVSGNFIIINAHAQDFSNQNEKKEMSIIHENKNNQSKSLEYEPTLIFNINQTFNGQNDFIDFSTDIQEVKDLDNGSIVVKFKSEATGIQTLFSISDEKDLNSHFELKLINGDIRLETTENGQNLMSYTKYNLNLNDGQWHTAIVTGGSLGGVMYIDGDKVVDFPGHPNKFISLVNEPTAINVGRSLNSNGGSSYFNGEISYVEIYNEQFSHAYGKKYSLNDYKSLLDIIHGSKDANVLFTGDSITQGVLHTNGYRTFSEHFRERFKGEHIGEFLKKDSLIINTGVSSGTTRDVLNGFDTWVTINNPNIVFITFGMNDCATMSIDEYKDNLREIVNKVRMQGAIPVLQTSNTTNGSRVTPLAQFMEGLREVANELEVFLIDHHNYWVENESNKLSWLNDAIHPNQKGHLEMAKLIFRELGIDDSESYTANLQYPLIGDGIAKPVLDSISYPIYTGLNDVKPVVSYKLNREFYGRDYLDKSDDISKIKDLNNGSIAARFNLTSGQSAQTILSLSDSTNSSKEVAIGINSNGSIFLNGRTDNGVVNFTTSRNGYNDNLWHTLVMNFNEDGISLYIDNEMIHSTSDKIFYSSLSNPTNLSIGKNVHDAGDEWFYNGAISYIDIYDEALTVNQIESISPSLETNSDFTEIRNKTLEHGVANSWVFLGSSMTSGTETTYGYKNYVEYFDERVRWEYNHNNMVNRQRFMVNSSSENYTSSDILQKFDVLATQYKPEIISIMLGDNETVTVSEFKSNLEGIIQKAKGIGVLVMLQTPVLTNQDITEYVDVINTVAKEQNVPVVDHYNKWLDLEKTNPHIRETFLSDDYSLNHRGHLRVAQDIMKALNIYSENSIACGARVDMRYENQDGVFELKVQLNELILKVEKSIADNINNIFDENLKIVLEDDLEMAKREYGKESSTIASINNSLRYLQSSLDNFEDSIIIPSIDKPVKVKNLKCIDKEKNQVTIEWHISTNSSMTKYIIYKDGKVVDTINVDSEIGEYTLSDLKANTIYNIKVVATNGNEENSRPVSLNIRTTK